MPERIQRKRTKGWRMPPNTVYVGRPSIFGNPFAVSADYSQFRAYADFKRWIEGEMGTGGGGLRRMKLLYMLPKLRGKDLACWCPLDQSCHADILLEIANRPSQQGGRVP